MATHIAGYFASLVILSCWPLPIARNSRAGTAVEREPPWREGICRWLDN